MYANFRNFPEPFKLPDNAIGKESTLDPNFGQVLVKIRDWF